MVGVVNRGSNQLHAIGLQMLGSTLRLHDGRQSQDTERQARQQVKVRNAGSHVVGAQHLQVWHNIRIQTNSNCQGRTGFSSGLEGMFQHKCGLKMQQPGTMCTMCLVNACQPYRFAAAAHDTGCHQSSDEGEDPNTTHDQERPPAIDKCLPALGIQLSLPSSAQVCGAIALCR